MVKQKKNPNPNFENFENRNFEIELKMSRKHQKWGFYITRLLSNNPAAQNVTNHRKNQFRSKFCNFFLDFVIFFQDLVNLLDHFDGPQLFFRDRTSLENARNGVFRSRRYCLKKSHRKILSFRKVTDFFKNAFFSNTFLGIALIWLLSLTRPFMYNVPTQQR